MSQEELPHYENFAPPAYQQKDGRSVYLSRPLEDPTIEIRLLKLRRRALLLGQVQYTIDVYYLDSAPAYRAISYTWGDPSPTSSVFIDKHEVQVRKNCHYALSQVRQHYPGDFIWIDSICIDQDNVVEKSAQVQMMGRIFSTAGSVSACLGPHANDSQNLIKNLRSSHDLTSRSELARQDWINRPYWYRLWIVQELCLAREIYVHCGSTAIPWADVYRAIKVSGSDVPYVQFLGELVNDAIVNRKPPTLHLQDHIKILEDARCADPRDKIFGLLNLAKPEDNQKLGAIRVDYSKSAWALALEIAKYPSALHSFSDQVSYLLPLLGITAENISFRSRLKLRARSRPKVQPRKKDIERVENLCADLLRWTYGQTLDVRRQHPGWVPSQGFCKTIRLCSSGTGCAHELYVAASTSEEVQTTLFRKMIAKPRTKPHWFYHTPEPGQGYKAVYHGKHRVAVVNQEAKDGDILISSELTPSSGEAPHLGKHLLIARNFQGDVYHIIGQGFMLPEFSDTYHADLESIWCLGAEDAMTAMAHLRLHECTQLCVARGQCEHWLDIVHTAVMGFPLSSFVFCRDRNPLKNRPLLTRCSICGMDPHQTRRRIERSKNMLRLLFPLMITAFAAILLHPVVAMVGLFLYLIHSITERGQSLRKARAQS